MEIVGGLIIFGFIILLFASNRSGTSSRRPPPRSGNRRKLPPVIRPNESYIGRRPGHTTTRKNSHATARQRTSGIEHDPPPDIPSSRKLVGRAWVIDGDTIAINRIKIRLAGIDAPELDQPWGRKSKWKMVEICKGNTIHVELTGETSYDRLVGTCYLPDGTDIGAEIIKAGLALDGSYYSQGKYLHLEPDGVQQRLKFYGLRQGR